MKDIYLIIARLGLATAIQKLEKKNTVKSREVAKILRAAQVAIDAYAGE